MHIHQYLEQSATVFPDRIAVRDRFSTLTYGELATRSDAIARVLIRKGVQVGDRVGLCMEKSTDAVAAIFGILKCGAAYVPVDVHAPSPRKASIFHDCTAKIILVTEKTREDLEFELKLLGGVYECLVLDGEIDAVGLPKLPQVGENDLAYILYTSGSTGMPKGVMLTHGNGLSFVDWCTDTFTPTEHDRFSSHAPFHFDLSVLDLFLPIKHGAELVLIDEALSKDPVRLSAWCAEERITVWYSAPSILSLMVQYGDLENYDFSDLRLVLFAGEVFPVKHLRALKALLPKPDYYNLYGPTETNVCTSYKVPDAIPIGRTMPFPIGQVCSHGRGRVVDGELWIAGEGVMQGYWKDQSKTVAAFVIDATGTRWYKTGDLVVEEEEGSYTFLGRKDRMVKKRGYRIELGEIETCLYACDHLEEVAVVAEPDDERGLIIKAFISAKVSTKPSMIALKTYCSEKLPAYMIPDVFVIQETLPRTSTGKTDYVKLQEF